MRFDPLAFAYRLTLPLVVLMAFIVTRNNHYWLAAAWALVILFAMLGWGGLVAFLMRPARPVDVGLRLGWGMAAMLVVGGVGCMLHLATRPFLLGHVLVGCALATFFALRRPTRLPSPRSTLATLARPAGYLLVALALVGVGIEFLGQLGTTWQQISDDPPLYFYMPEKIVQTGSFFEPFAVRRVTTYGGQVYLHALFLAVGRHYQLNVVDSGIGTSVVLALLVGAAAPKGLRRAHLGVLVVSMFVLLTVRDVRFNIGALMTGLAACLATYRTFLWMLEDPGSSRRQELGRVAILAACAVAVCVLRTSNAVPVALFLFAATVKSKLPGEDRWRRATASLLVLAGAGIILLMPWLVLLNESVGTFIYPLRHGNITPGFIIVKPEPGSFYNVKHLLKDLGFDRPFALPMFALAVGLIPALRARDAYVRVVCVTSFLGMCLMSYVGGGFDEVVNARYYFAFLMWAIFAIVLSLPQWDKAALGVTPMLRATLIVAVAVGHVVLSHDDSRKRTAALMENFERAAENAGGEAQKDEYATQDYRDVQYHAAEGAGIVVAVAEPFRFDMKRNRIFSLDQPSAMGPKGEYPAFQGPEKVAAYFAANGIRYVIAMDFHKGHELYDIERWKRHMLLQNSFLNYEAPYMVDGMENVEKLGMIHRVVYTHFGMRLIDLSLPPQEPAPPSE